MFDELSQTLPSRMSALPLIASITSMDTVLFWITRLMTPVLPVSFFGDVDVTVVDQRRRAGGRRGDGLLVNGDGPVQPCGTVGRHSDARGQGLRGRGPEF